MMQIPKPDGSAFASLKKRRSFDIILSTIERSSPFVKIIEQSCIGKKKDQSLNEDAVIVTENYIAVIDGATSCCPDWGAPGGLLARELAADYIRKAKPEEDGFSFFLGLNSVLREYQQSRPELFTYAEKRLMASALVFSVSNNQLWNYGDCHYLINGKHYQINKRIDALTAELRSFINNCCLHEGASERELLCRDKGAEEITRYLDMQPCFANTETAFGYPILDGGQISPHLLISHQLKKGDSVIMATDGYPFLEPSLEESEKRLLILKESDPLLIREFKAAKGFYPDLLSFDDRTYIRFIV